MQENNWVIATKKGQGKLPLFHGNGEQVFTIYATEGNYKWCYLLSLKELAQLRTSTFSTWDLI